MKTYLVSCTALCGDNGRFLVGANNKQEAIDKVWETHYQPKNVDIIANGYSPYYKKDLYVQRIDNLLNKDNELPIIQVF